MMNAQNAPDEPSPRHVETLWAIHMGGAQYDYTLLNHGMLGVEVQVSRDGAPFYSRRFPSRELAVAAADGQKTQYLRDGGFQL